jgi:hypothetical protein
MLIQESAVLFGQNVRFLSCQPSYFVFYSTEFESLWEPAVPRFPVTVLGPFVQILGYCLKICDMQMPSSFNVTGSMFHVLTACSLTP